MANLTAARVGTGRKLSAYDMDHKLPFATSAAACKGGRVALNSCAAAGRGGTGASVTSGVSDTTNAVAAAGDRCKFTTGIFKFTNGSTAVTAAMRGNLCYADDDHTVSSDETKPIAGIVYDVDSDGVWVLIRPSIARVGAAT